MPQTDKSRRIHPPSEPIPAPGDIAAGLGQSLADLHDRHPVMVTSAALGAGLVAGAVLARLLAGRAEPTLAARIADTASQIGRGLRERAGDFAEASGEMLSKAGEGTAKAAQVVAEKSSETFFSMLNGLGSLANLVFSVGLGRLFAK